MSDQENRPGADRRVLELVEKLKAVQRACAERTPAERGKALRTSLAEELGRMPGDRAEKQLEELRVYLGGRDAEAARKLDTLAAETHRLRGEVEGLRKERDRLLREQTVLEPSPGAGAADLADLQKVREGLLKILEDRKLTPEEAGIPPSLAPLFQTIAELLRFALDLEIGLQGFLRASEVGEVGMMGTRQFAEHERMIRDRFRSCFQNRENAIPHLREVLKTNLRLLLSLHTAYDTSINQGTRAILDLLDPHKILEETKGRLGVNHPEAWKRLSRLLSELAALEKDEVWERYFEEPFRKRLRRALDEGRPAGDS